ncbi:bifunctional nicotinamide mononucleotide adenylyltransferase/ADP-ribose pyrophosphatase [Chlamydia abortus]|uniref:NUDIX domain-containing protein n=1 Tax=Paenibacillus residui TaxID=629724 RepID=A0ABW3DIR6_9BACL|nr:bifunctional nicotinamide mononucleotide adenylyltransferase/ADP-ribose pyrophosphatase [Chlamydia abortus]
MEKIRLRAAALIIEEQSILLVEFRNEQDDGVHYNLPAGGVEPGETLVEAAIREAREEASVDIDVGPVAFVYEYQPAKNNYIYGDVHSVGITFACRLKDGSVPRLPDRPDPAQTGVKWVPLSELSSVQLYPEIADDILNYCNGHDYRNYVEEHEIQSEKAGND